jgi:flagellar motor switch protein FliN/FliY
MANDMLSQEEIDVLLKGTSNTEVSTGDYDDYDEFISDIERDALGEIGNISMGTAATTLSTLLNKKVTITTPRVMVTTAADLAYEYQIPFVAIDVGYKAGLEGSNILILDTDDVKIITDLMMGKETIDVNREISELDLSAVSEAMNQMMGSSSTSLSEMFMKKIDIKPPKSYEITFSEGREKFDLLKSDVPIIKISFKMVVGDLIDSQIMQLIPLDFGKEMVDILLGGSLPIEETPIMNVESASTVNLKRETEDDDYQNKFNNKSNYVETEKINNIENMNKNDNNIKKIEKEKVVVRKPDFEHFDTSPNVSYNESIDLVGDIPVEITVELGRTNKRISEILEYGPGTVIELDKLVGEALNIYANGKYIAKGEVVVIDDNFGIRVTEIDNPYKKNR